MKIYTDMVAWRKARSGFHHQEVGFVPTMGALHDGHLALVEQSLSNDDHTVVSIFLNPTQFDQADDLENYPGHLEEDLASLREAGVDSVLLPDAVTIYPDEFRYRVTETRLSRQLEGTHRVGHFDGVLTVVMRLLNLVQPRRAYFGEKDWQQLELVRGMVEAFFMPVEIVACATVREPDGLAMSSRNLRLSPAQRALAPQLHRALVEAVDTAAARRLLEARGFDVDYVDDQDGRRLAAARLGEVRLIDNVSLAEIGEDA